MPFTYANRWWKIRQYRIAPYLFVSPFLVIFAIFMVYPISFGLFLSLHEWSGIGEMRYIGIKNYINLFQDSDFRLAFSNTLWYIGASLFINLVIALVMATLLNSALVKFKKFFRTVYFMPIVTSVVAAAIVFTLFYDRDYGLFNAPLIFLHHQPLDWLGSTSLSKFAVIGLIAWRWTGFNMVYFLAGLQSVPKSLYEAASIDGATSFQCFTKITIPLLKPIILFVMVITLVGSIQIFDEPYVLTGGGPSDSSMSLVIYLFRTGTEYLNLGYAAAISFVIFGMTFALSWLQLNLTGTFKKEGH